MIEGNPINKPEKPTAPEKPKIVLPKEFSEIVEDYLAQDMELSINYQNLDMQLESVRQQVEANKNSIIKKQLSIRETSKAFIEQYLKTQKVEPIPDTVLAYDRETRVVEYTNAPPMKKGLYRL